MKRIYTIAISTLLVLGSCGVPKEEHEALLEKYNNLVEQVEVLGLTQPTTNKSSTKSDMQLKAFLKDDLATLGDLETKANIQKALRDDFEDTQKDQLKRGHDRTQGRLFKRSEIRGIKEYEKWSANLNEISANYLPKYFFLGKDRFDELVKMVENYQTTDPNKEIAGYHIKLRFKQHPDFGSRVKMLDAMLVPAAVDGTSIFDMYVAPNGSTTLPTTSVSTNGSGLDESVPCPDKCPNQ